MLRDPSLSQAQASQLLTVWQQELSRHDIRLAVIGMREWPRPGFTQSAIMDALMRVPLERPCDRILALTSRHAGDVAWGTLFPEVLGSVNDATYTHGYVVATTASLTGLMMGGAGDVLVHEGYHLLGCGHWSWSACHAQIAKLRAETIRNATEGRDFVVALTPDGDVFRTREAVNETLGLKCTSPDC